MKEYDIAVLGAGVSGLAAARRAAELGARVCLVEEDRIGGTSFHKGLYPFQRILGFFSGQRAQEGGPGPTGNLPGEPVDPSRLFQEARQVTQEIARKWEKTLHQAGVRIVKGTGTLTGPGQICIENGEEPGTLSASKVILATGSVPVAPATVPFDGERILPVDDIDRLKTVPANVLILGSGKAGCETATLFNRLGSKAFLSDSRPRLLSGQDPDVQDLVETILKKQKFKVLLGKKMVSHFKEEEKVDITLEGGIKFSVQALVFTGNRKPRTERMDLAKIGVRTGEGGEILVNETQSTSVSGVFAVGSVTGRPGSQHRSEEEGRVAAENALGKKKVLNLDWIPQVVYTDPEVATVGCFAGDAHHRGLRAVEGRCPFQEIDYAWINGEERGLFKVVAERETGQVIGGQIVARRASELIPLVLLAIKKGLTVNALAMLSCGWNTQFQGIREAARDCVQTLKARP